MRELLALAIDRTVSAEVSKINKEVGKSVYMDNSIRTRSDERLIALNLDLGYENLLHEYVELKLILHHARKSIYYRGDWYSERADVDVAKVWERCDTLRGMIREKRKAIQRAAWGDLTPWTIPTPYDKPILHSMDEHTCSFVLEEDEDSTSRCPLVGNHWFYGSAYCRKHMREARRAFHQQQRKEKKPFSCCSTREAPHYHSLGKVHY